MIIQCQFLNAVLQHNDSALLLNNNLTPDFFSDYLQEYNFLINHIKNYNTLPDITTFVDKFPNFDVVEVNESNKFLIDKLYEERKFRIEATLFNAIREALNNNEIQKAQLLFSEAHKKLQISNNINFTDITEDISRYQTYLDKCNNFDNYYVSTGFPELDQIIGGWDRKEDYVTIVARPNVGKTYILLKSLQSASMHGLRVGLYSGEMSAAKVGYRLDTWSSHISNYAMTHGDISIRDDYKEYLDNIKKINKGPIFVITPNDVGGKCGINALRTFIEQAELDILFIDQHSLLYDDNHSKDPVTRAANISRDIKMLQVEKQIPIITVSQQNRSTLVDGQVGTELVAQTDRIGQDSTVVIFLEKQKDILTMTLVKARDASNTGKIKYVWDINSGRLTYMPTDDDSANHDEASDDLKNRFEPDYDEGEESFS